MSKVISLDTPLPPLPPPYGLTIGTFDGVHRGHLALLSALKQSSTTTAVLTFRSPPAAYFGKPLQLITTLPHKLKLLTEAGVDLIYLLDFDAQIASQPYDFFLLNIHRHYPFSTLILGQGATLGKDRLGDHTRLPALATEYNFTLRYQPKLPSISSGAIRKLIRSGDIKQASTLLGRPYSIYTPSFAPTLSLPDLCLPPSGIYPVRINTHPGTATVYNQTLTLTLDQNLIPLLMSSPTEILFN